MDDVGMAAASWVLLPQPRWDGCKEPVVRGGTQCVDNSLCFNLAILDIQVCFASTRPQHTEHGNANCENVFSIDYVAALPPRTRLSFLLIPWQLHC
jgi:hypothetical protein